MTTALASVYSGIPARSDTAMTGEVTLTGLVLPIGGVKEKVLAARRAGLKRVILPRGNQKDLRDLARRGPQGDGRSSSRIAWKTCSAEMLPGMMLSPAKAA